MSPASPPPLIVLDNVAMTFGDQKVLDNITIAITAGQTLVVIGESGCGKTVLLKLIIGLLRPTRGKIIFDNKVLADLDDRELTRQRLRFGFLFQGAALFDSLSVFDNVAFGLREQPGLKPADIQNIVRQRLQEVGLPEGIVEKKPAELSGGMKKRVGLARALALNPEVMLYDEPTTGLDPIMSDVINELILQTRQRHPVPSPLSTAEGELQRSELQRSEPQRSEPQRSERVTSIVVTHDMKTAQKVADRVIMFYPLARLGPGESQILFDGPPDQLQTCPDPRVRQFVVGEAGGRLQELAGGG